MKMKNTEIKVIDLTQEADVGEFTNLVKGILEEGERKSNVAAALTDAMRVFVETNLRTADKYGMDRNAIMKSALHTFVDAVLEFDWNEYDLETHDIKQEAHDEAVQ